jgi:tricorn protease
LATPLPMPRAGAGEFSPDGTQIVYAPLFRDFRSWKRYQGGWAQDLYTFDPVSLRTTNISDQKISETTP